MKIALRELARRPGRFLFVGSALTLLSVLLLLLGGLLDGLFLGGTGAIRAQDAEVFVYSSDAQESFLRSRIGPDLRDQVERVAGVDRTGGLGVTLDAGRRGDDDELLDLAVVGYEQDTTSIPEPPAPGAAWADESLKDSGVSVGDTILIGTSEVPLEVVGFVYDSQYLLQSSLWVELGTWHEVQAASRPDAALAPDVFQVLLVDTSGDGADLASRIDQATADATTSLTRDEAVLSLPGTSEQNATFTALIGTTVVVVGLITALFFVLLTVERTGLYAAMKALGVDTRRLLLWSATQAAVIATGAFVVGGGLSIALSSAVPASLPLRLEPERAVITLVILVATALAGCLIPIRRIVRIDPADAIS